MHFDCRFNSALAFVAFFFATTHAFYIPGISTKTYSTGESIPLLVNKVHSSKTQLQYAYAELPFVCPSTGKKRPGSPWTSGTTLSLNLGEVLRGDRITVSDYELVMGKDEDARLLCEVEANEAAVQRGIELIRDGYVAEWIVDNLPGATSFVTADKTKKYYAAGFKMGHDEIDKQGQPHYFLNNHVTLQILYRNAPGREGEQGKKVIVGFEVYPKSVEAGNRDKKGIPKNLDNPKKGLELDLKSDSNGEPNTMKIPYTYSVYFKEDKNLEWSNRWDMYFVNQDDSSRVHWFAIINSLIICGLLTAIVAVILARTIRGDIAAGAKDTESGGIRMRRRKSMRKSTDNGILSEPDAAEEVDDNDDIPLEEITGWKLLHGDVFRPPTQGGLLAPLIGSGMQLMFMAIGLVLLSCLGILNPSFRGGFISVGFALFIFAGVFSGYYSARVYKTFGGEQWRKNVLVHLQTATLVPGLVFAITFILNFFVWGQASSTAIPFSTLLALVALWLLIQLPLVYFGSYYGFTHVGAWEHPIKTNAIARQIPASSWNTTGRTVQTVLLAGLIPFAVIFVELLFVFKNMWQDKTGYYYVFGFMAVVGVILLLTIVEVTIVAVYMRLCAENHHWHWYAFFVGGASSAWVFAYCIWFFFMNLHITGFVSGLLFFSYSFLACAVYGLLTGTVGFLAAYAFVRRIYAAIKID
ncbi:hypothetical protein NA57DRAFT_61556 [Rhizodiscina lignyota]|uniref:Transmembrane 9 superfamily member n=1 Tax=Rhizodiscina lignyota TaxID=1504668 RepID=A0A9P4I1T8_9PEZI|nr:hypothetical protein NA57DRAFT_61556 [Rhizodiscina lignyota]